MAKGNEVPKWESHYVYMHKGDEFLYYGYGKLVPRDLWDDYMHMNLDDATTLAEKIKSKNPEWTVCIGKHLIQVDPFFDIIVVQ